MSTVDQNEAVPIVTTLAEAHDPAIFGNKASSLALLIHQGIAVPMGFVVSFEAYKRTFDQSGVTTDDDGVSQGQFSIDFFDKSFVELVAAHLNDLRSQVNNAEVVVRSSSNAEDSTAASFAGQFTTVLNVKSLEECLRAIWKCWQSARNANVIAYCEKQGIDPNDLKMGVIIQLQRDPDAAGVLFTQDPFSFSEGVIYAEGVAGIASELVDGSQEPDFRFWLSQGKHILREDCFVEKSLVPESARVHLAHMAKSIQKAFGTAQDIEWVFTEIHGVEIVQARPITSERQAHEKRHPDAWQLAGTPAGGWGEQQRQVFDQWDIYNSKSITPLDWGLFERLDWEANLRMFDFLPNVPHVEDVAVVADGVVVGVDPTARQRNRDQKARVPTYPVVDDWEPVFAAWESRLEELHRHFEHATDNAVELSRLLVLTGGLYAECHCVRMASTARWIDPMGELDPAEDAESKIRDLLEREYGDETNTVIVDVGAGINHETARMSEELWKLCQEAVESGESKITPQVRSKVESFVEKFGHFQHDNIALGNNPEFVFDQIQQALEEGNAGPNRVEDGRRRFRARLVEMEHRYPTEEFSKIEREINRLRLWTERRESSKSKQNIALPLMRKIAYTLGDLLQSKGILDDHSDVQFFDPSELSSMASGDWTPPSGLVALRKNYCNWKSQRTWLPEGFFGGTGDRSQDTFLGEGVSEGTVQGRVRVVEGPEEFSKVENNDIIVASTTSPIWSQVMSKIAGIVVEFGARLSHTSIAAREYNIPAIINVRNAKDIFVDGDLIEVDGSSGVARFIERNEG